VAISATEFVGRTVSDADWIIKGWLSRKNSGFIMGQPKKCAKSWLLLDAAWSLGEGNPVWGVGALMPPRPLRTIYFTQEDSEGDITKRMLAHLGAGRPPNDRVWIVPKNLNMVLDTPEGRKLIEDELDSVRETAGAIDLVMFDPMRRMHHGEENDSATIAKLWRVIDIIHSRYDCATLISHHVKKPPSDRSGHDPTDPFEGRGSGDIYGGGDAFGMVVPGKLAPDGKSWRQVIVHFESKRGEQMPPAELRVDFTTGRVTQVNTGILSIDR
jgi:RecA-family ATPase